MENVDLGNNFYKILVIDVENNRSRTQDGETIIEQLVRGRNLGCDLDSPDKCQKRRK